MDSQRLWVVWRGSQGDCSVTNSYLLESGQTALWMPSVLEPAPPRDYIPADSNLDPRQAYSDYIFYPGRFPFFVIIRALSVSILKLLLVYLTKKEFANNCYLFSFLRLIYPNFIHSLTKLKFYTLFKNHLKFSLVGKKLKE